MNFELTANNQLSQNTQFFALIFFVILPKFCSKKKYMAKSKTGSSVSPETYIKTRVRTLEIKSCYITENWKSAGIATIIISRQHKNGNITHALYQVDLLSQGIINTFFEFNLAGDKYPQVIEYYKKEQNLIECSYDLVHQIIYGAYDFANQSKLKSHKDFALTQFVLEPRSHEIKDKIDIEFGEDGIPLVIVTLEDDKKKLISTLEKNIGSSNFKVMHISELAEEHNHKHGHEHEHDHNHDHDEPAFDLPDFLNPIDVLDKDNVENWTDNDWEDFENGKKEITPKMTLQVIDFMYNSHFTNEKTDDRINLELIDFKKLNISREPIAENNNFSSEEEEERINSIFLEVLENPNQKHIELLEGELAINSNNPQLYSYLANANIKLGNIDKADEWTELGYKRFPNYLFGQISYAQTLLQKGESSKVPVIFKNKFDLKSLLPSRKEFHILEVINFNAIMCLYFSTQGDIASANVYWSILKEINEREEELVLLAENELMVLKAKILKGE